MIKDINNANELPNKPLPAYVVKDKTKAQEIAGDRDAWLLNATWDGVMYLYINLDSVDVV